jgi:hypothetical protein
MRDREWFHVKRAMRVAILGTFHVKLQTATYYPAKIKAAVGP